MVVLCLCCFQGLTRTLPLFAVVVEVTGHAHVLLAAFEKVNGLFFPLCPCPCICKHFHGSVVCIYITLITVESWPMTGVPECYCSTNNCLQQLCLQPVIIICSRTGHSANCSWCFLCVGRGCATVAVVSEGGRCWPWLLPCSFPGPRALFAELDLLCPDPVAPLFGLSLHVAPSPFKELGYILHKDFELHYFSVACLM